MSSSLGTDSGIHIDELSIEEINQDRIPRVFFKTERTEIEEVFGMKIVTGIIVHNSILKVFIEDNIEVPVGSLWKMFSQEIYSPELLFFGKRSYFC